MNSVARPARLLVVDDELSVRSFLSDLYKREGYEVVATGDASSAEAILENEDPFDLMFTDIMMPDVDGLELLARVRKTDPELPVVLITGHPSVEFSDSASRCG